MNRIIGVLFLKLLWTQQVCNNLNGDWTSTSRIAVRTSSFFSINQGSLMFLPGGGVWLLRCGCCFVGWLDRLGGGVGCFYAGFFLECWLGYARELPANRHCFRFTVICFILLYNFISDRFFNFLSFLFLVYFVSLFINWLLHFVFTL